MGLWRVRKTFNQTFSVERRRLAFVLDVMKDSEEAFLAVDDVFGSGKPVASEKGAFRAHSSGPRIDRVLHVRQFSCRHRAWTKCASGADPDRRNHLIDREIQNAAGRDRRGERTQGGVMPTIFPHARPTDFAKTHFDFVGNDCGENQILAG